MTIEELITLFTEQKKDMQKCGVTEDFMRIDIDEVNAVIDILENIKKLEFTDEFKNSQNDIEKGISRK